MPEILFFPNKLPVEKTSGIKKRLIEEGLTANVSATIEANVIADFDSFVADLDERFKSGVNLSLPPDYTNEQLRVEVQSMIWKMRDDTLKVFMVNRYRTYLHAALHS